MKQWRVWRHPRGCAALVTAWSALLAFLHTATGSDSWAVSIWRYEPPHYAYLAVRTSPEQDAQTTGRELRPGEVFEVKSVKETEGTTFLELADCQGWILADHPFLGRLCLAHQGLTLWRFQPPQHKPLDLRSNPEITSQRTGHRLLPGTVFHCVQEVAAPSDPTQRFLQLQSGQGWAFDKAGSIRLCHREQSFRTAKVAKEERPAIPAHLLEPPVAEMAELKRFSVEELCLGQRLTGYVSSVDNEGVFVDVGAEVEGWVHISLLSDDYVEDPFEVVKVGDEVHTIVTQIMTGPTPYLTTHSIAPLPSSSSRSRLYLSMAPSKSRLLPNEEGSRPEVGSRHDGLVSVVTEFGVNVVLGDARGGRGHEGFLHVSKMTGYVRSVPEAFKIGDRLNVQVIGDSEGRRLELSTKAIATEDLDDRQQWLEAKVYNIKPFGIFVEVTATSSAGTQGMVHISQIREGYVKDIFEEVEVGEVVQVRVLSKEAGRVKFTMLPD